MKNPRKHMDTLLDWPETVPTKDLRFENIYPKPDITLGRAVLLLCPSWTGSLSLTDPAAVERAVAYVRPDKLIHPTCTLPTALREKQLLQNIP